MSLVTFWCGVVVVGSFYLAYLAGCEQQIRERLREWDREQRRRGGL